MTGISRIVLIGLVFALMVGLFVYMQRDSDDGLEERTSPSEEKFVPASGSPRLVSPGSATSGDEEDGTALAAGRSPALSDGAETDAGADGGEARSAGVVSLSGSGNDSSASSRGGLIQDLERGLSATPPGPGPGGLSDGLQSAPPVTEMISLPATGPAPEGLSGGMQSLPPQEGSPALAIAPEAGSSGMTGSAPELLPVTHPGPSGELPPGEETGPQ